MNETQRGCPAACANPKGKNGWAHPFACVPRLARLKEQARYPPAPDDASCFELWHKYDMLPNVRAHSMMVAHIATSLALRAQELGKRVSVPDTRASALLHDIAKTYCLRYGGSHAMLGAAWTANETGHYGIAQGVLLHVCWPWELPAASDICSLPFLVIYADKRVRHEKCVTLADRFDDLLERYGKTEAARADIRASHEQAKQIELALSGQLKWKLNEDYFDCGRLVQ